MQKVLLVAVSLFLLAGCGVSDETTQAIALQALGEGGKILYSEHIPAKLNTADNRHIFVGKDQKGTFHYLRVDGEKIVKDEVIQQ